MLLNHNMEEMASSKDSREFPSSAAASTDFLNNELASESTLSLRSRLDLLDGAEGEGGDSRDSLIHGKQEIDVKEVQPNIQVSLL